MKTELTTKERRQQFLDNSIAHFEADEKLIKRTFGKMNGQFKGCSVGCHAYDILGANQQAFEQIDQQNFDDSIHQFVSDHYDYPVWLAHLQDWVFEKLPDGDNRKWHVELAKAVHAVPDDVDWQSILHKTHIGLLRISYRTAGSATKAVEAVIDLHQQALDGEVARSAWSATQSAAMSAAMSAARFAADSAAEYAGESGSWSASWCAAHSASWSAQYAADFATEYVARYVADSAGKSAAIEEIRDVVLAALTNPDTASQLGVGSAA